MYGYNLSPLETAILFHYYRPQNQNPNRIMNSANISQLKAATDRLIALEVLSVFGKNNDRISSLNSQLLNTIDRAIARHAEYYHNLTNITVWQHTFASSTSTYETFARSIQTINPLMSGNHVLRRTSGAVLYSLQEDLLAPNCADLLSVVDVEKPIQWYWQDQDALISILGFVMEMNPDIGTIGDIEKSVSHLLIDAIVEKSDSFPQHTCSCTINGGNGLTFTYRTDFNQHGYPLVVSADLDAAALFDTEILYDDGLKFTPVRELISKYNTLKPLLQKGKLNSTLSQIAELHKPIMSGNHITLNHSKF